MPALSGSTSARIVPPSSRARATPSPTRSIRANSGASGVTPRASMVAVSRMGGAEIRRPCGPSEPGLAAPASSTMAATCRRVRALMSSRTVQRSRPAGITAAFSHAPLA